MCLSLKLRKGVVGVFTNAAGHVLIGERTNQVGAWQFPQGGIDEHEDFDTALVREMEEELGTNQFEVVRSSSKLTSYIFPKNLNSRIVKNYDGQTHKWYVLRFTNGAEPKIELSDGEFRAFKWMPPNEVLALVIDWKRDAYREGLLSLNFVVE